MQKLNKLAEDSYSESAKTEDIKKEIPKIEKQFLIQKKKEIP